MELFYRKDAKERKVRGEAAQIPDLLQNRDSGCVALEGNGSRMLFIFFMSNGDMMSPMLLRDRGRCVASLIPGLTFLSFSTLL